MVYIYSNGNNITYTRTKPQNVENYITLKRMLPIPHKNGYIPKLKADFNSKKCWFELEEIPLTPIQEKENELKTLKEKLESSFDLLIRFLEGDLSVTEYAETKLKRYELRTKIRAVESELLALKGEKNE